MASIKPSSRYSNNNSTTSSFFTTTSNSPRSSAKSDPSSSTEHLYSSSKSSCATAIVKTNDRRNTNNNNFSSLVKRLIETKSNTSKTSKKGSAADPVKLFIAAEHLAENLKKPTSGGKNASFFHKKLFKGGPKREEAKSDRKALTEVKGNTRTLAMVLRSERELLSSNKELEAQISELKLTLGEKNREVDKLKDLCLKQREEIKSLKSAILFPDVMNSQLEQLLEKQGSELKQAKQLIPSLQEQVSSLTGQLQCIAVDLAEVKADKYSMRGFCDAHNSPRALMFDQDDDAANSLDFSSSSHTPIGSPDDLFLKDLNPCLTPHDVRKKMEETEKYDSTDNERPFRGKYVGFEGCARKLSISSDYHRQRPKTSSSRPVRAGCRSDESKATLGKHKKRF